ncbi:hypothetical protein K353_05920 [Kitasatospora sp. SolWspMP-SS2h]|uniref:hypothetical protein n=1 Tax=Kitasatospora sp. SolWspMP-SS2h TaxID=1305729 RepID=UPI000DBFA16E|nr:hypothetical protein [Kitasatospora sp. SolWspMP-SS2h]RAJ32044.1 hypothetical protein K353_05920 [Kitasatospora sp. SolWspMP-SS2h]
MDVGEEVFEEVAGRAFGVEGGEADGDVVEVGVVVAGVFCDGLLEVFELVVQGDGVEEEAVGDVHGVADEGDDGFVRAGGVLDEAEDDGGGLVGECFDSVCFEDDLGGVFAGGFGGGEQFGGAEGVLLEEPVGGTVLLQSGAATNPSTSASPESVELRPVRTPCWTFQLR